MLYSALMNATSRVHLLHFGSPGNALLWGTLMAATTTGASIALKYLTLAAPLRLLLVLVPLAPTTVYILSCVRSVRRADELIRRIHLEACAFCLPATVLLAMLVSLLVRAGFVSGFRWEWETIAIAVVSLYAVGYFLARRHYR